MNVSLNNNDIYRYEILHNGKIHKITEPFEWKSLNNQEDRIERYSGIFHKSSNTLTFTGETALLLESIYNKDKLHSEAVLIVKRKENGEFIIEYSNDIDFSEYNYDLETVSIRLSDGGYFEKFSAHNSKSINIDSKTDVYNKPVSDISYKTVGINGIKLLNVNEFKSDDLSGLITEKDCDLGGTIAIIDHKLSRTMNDNGCGETCDSITPLLTSKVTKSDKQSHEQTVSWAETAVTSQMCYVNDTDKTIGATIKTDLNFMLEVEPLELGMKFDFKITIEEYDIDDNGLYIKNNNTLILNHVAKRVEYGSVDVMDISVNKIKYKEIKPKTALSLTLEMIYTEYFNTASHTWTVPASTDTPMIFRIKSQHNENFMDLINPESLKFSINTETKFEPTKNKALTIKDLIYKQFELIGIRNIKSNVLNTGRLKNVLVANGFMFRNFPLDNDDFKSISISLKDSIESIMAVFNIGIGIENDKGIETFIVEDKSYFYNSNTLDLTGITSKIKSIKPNTQDYYNLVKVGYKSPDKDRLYENEIGLDEYNTQREYSTDLNKKIHDKDLTSKIRADIYGIELVRMEQWKEGEKKDTSRDNSVWFIDCKHKYNDYYVPRTWEDDLERKPLNIYDSDNAYNLLLTPLHILINNIEYLKSSLKEDAILKLINLSGNAKLITRLSGGRTLVENADINVSDFKQKKFDAELVEIQINVSSELYDLIRKNRYKILMFKTDKGIIHGYLNNVQENKNIITIKPL